MDRNLDRALEALLFTADGTVELSELAEALQVEPTKVREALATWSERRPDSGLAVALHGSGAQMVTHADLSETIERFLGIDTSGRLSSAALETLATVAYLQPVTRSRIDGIRGVNSGGVLRTLIARDLVVVVGRLQQVGRPQLYGTTFAFLQYMGIERLEQLPPLPERQSATPDMPQQPDDA